MLHPLRRGTVLRRSTPGSVEAGIVWGPSEHIPHAVELVHGYVDAPPTAGLFCLTHEHLARGVWRIASDEEAAAVRALFLEHAEAWGPDSASWIAREPDPDPEAWTSPPVAMRWST